MHIFGCFGHHLSMYAPSIYIDLYFNKDIVANNNEQESNQKINKTKKTDEMFNWYMF